MFIIRKIGEEPKPAPAWCALAFTNSEECFPDTRLNYYRGFPFTTRDEYGYTDKEGINLLPSKSEDSSVYIMNFLIFALGIPLITSLGYKLIHRRNK